MLEKKDQNPTRCPWPCIKLCQDCKYGWVKYPEWVETAEDLEGICFESGCTIGLESTIPTKEEEAEFDKEAKEYLKQLVPDDAFPF